MTNNRRIIHAVDLFCGAGGTSSGLRRACDDLGVDLRLLAINHWPVAIETHTRNNPDVQHLCAAVDNVNPRDVVPGGYLDLLIASPECTHHSRARGGKPVSDQKRASGWLVLRWLEALKVKSLLIENVPEFAEWGPIGVNGLPMKSRRGETFRAWIAAIESLGYRVESKILCAADYGDPTTRERLFILAHRGRRQAIEWPEPTHGRVTKTLLRHVKPWRAAREIIDWSIKGQSIFHRKRPLSPKTMARVLAGLEKFGGPDLKPFIVVLRNNMAGRSLDVPLSTISANGQHHALAEPFVMPVTHGSDTSQRGRSIDEPLPTVTAAHRGELALVEPFVLQQQSGGVPRSTAEPLPTVTTDGAQMLVEPFVVGYHSERAGEARRIYSAGEPLPTLTTENRFAVVEPFLVPHYGERPGQEPRTHSIDAPMPTIPASGDGKFELVQSEFIASYYGTHNVSTVDELLPTVTTKDRFALVAPVINGRKLDIRLRMLKPHELAGAMSFGADYKFTGNQGEQVKQIGNAVPVELARALCRQQLASHRQQKRKKRTCAA